MVRGADTASLTITARRLTCFSPPLQGYHRSLDQGSPANDSGISPMVNGHPGARMRLTLNAAEENPMRWLRVLICSVLITGMEFAAAVGLARPAFAAVLECPS